MRVERRDFLRTAGTGFLVAAGSACGSSGAGSSGNSPVAVPNLTPKQLTIKIFGGLAVVAAKSGDLVVGNVKVPPFDHTTMPAEACIHEHGLEMKLTKGKCSNPEASKIPTALTNPKDPNGPRLWLMNGHRVAVDGLPAGGHTLPPDGGRMTVPVPVTDWNNLENVFQPLTYDPAKPGDPKMWRLHPDFTEQLLGAITIPTGTLSVVQSRHNCIEGGQWQGVRNGNVVFQKPLNSVTQVVSKPSQAVTFRVSADEILSIQPDANGEIEVELHATSPVPPPTVFTVGDLAPHLGMFYGLLVKTADGMPIEHKDRIIPKYYSYNNSTAAGTKCEYAEQGGGIRRTPGIGCPDSVIVEP